MFEMSYVVLISAQHSIQLSEQHFFLRSGVEIRKCLHVEKELWPR